jgi:transposase
LDIADFLPHIAGLRLLSWSLSADEIRLEMAPLSRSATCPNCQQSSRRVHSRYTRRIADEPIGGRAMSIRVSVRRFRCGAAVCPRRTFVEQIPCLVARSARRSVPLQSRIEDIAVSLGGRPGARFAGRRRIRISRVTLVRLVRALPEPAPRAPKVLGVDDFAVRRGHRYGTVLVDLEARQPIDLLPDRRAETFTAWLKERGQPEIICRDRAGAYAEGARAGAPHAIQVADRFHLARNTSDVLERIVARHPAALRATVAEESSEGDATAPARTDPAIGGIPQVVAEPAPPNPRRERRLARYQTVVALHERGWSHATIGRQVGLHPVTVAKYLRAESFPEWAPRRTLLSAGTAHATYLQARWTDGCRDAQVLWRELQARGFTGSLRLVQRAVAPWREGPRQRRTLAVGTAPTPTPLRPPSARTATWLLLRPIDDLTPTEQTMRARLLDKAPDVATALDLLATFRRLIRTRDGPAFGLWLETTDTCSVAEVRGFTASLRRDQMAVMAALSSPWSSGQVEGQVTKTKLIKRQMYGRANFDLLRRRVLLAS